MDLTDEQRLRAGCIGSQSGHLCSPTAPYTISVSVSIAEMAATWRRHEAERRARALVRARRLLDRLPEARETLIGHHGASGVFLFGSLATGDCREDSDVDLAVDGLAPERYFEALADVMAIVGGPVDLVRLEEAGGSLRDRIRAEGRRL